MSEIMRDSDISRLLARHYQEVEMETAFRLTLLDRTRQLVASRNRVWRRRLVFAAAAAVVIGVTILVVYRNLPTPHVGNHAPITAESPGRAAPVAPSSQVRPAVTHPIGEAGGGQKAGNLQAAIPIPLPAVSSGKPFLAVVAIRAPATDQAGRRLKIGERLASGAEVRTGPKGKLTLVTRRGSEYTLNANSRLRIASASSGQLLAGEVYCRSRAGEINHISTPAGSIELLGTVLDAAIHNHQSVAVTVLHGKVRLANAHGSMVVGAGKKAILVASAAPETAVPTNTAAVTAWYDGRSSVLSDFGDIAYTVRRGDLVSQIWVMKADGSGKRLLKSMLGATVLSSTWFPGQQLLFSETYSSLWTQPDFTAHRAHAGAGHPIVGTRQWLLNAATGEDAVFELPKGYDPLYSVISPNANWLAFNGSYRPSQENWEKAEGGVWAFNLQTREMKKLLNGWIKTWVAWSPDSKQLVATTGEGYGSNYPLVLVDVESGRVRNLNVQGAGPSFSPDGKKIAYCGEFQGAGSWYRGVLATGSVQVLNLAPGSRPRRVSENGVRQPRWSPDGRRIVYSVDHRMKVMNADRGPVYPAYSIFVAQADGSSVKEIYRKEPTDAKGHLQAVAWAPSGDAVYLSTDQGVLLVAADGSGILQNLGGNETDSLLTPEQDAQMKTALTAIQEAVFQFAVGNVRAYEGKPAESKGAFASASDLFASLPHDYPLAQFSINDVLGYADKAAELAARPTNEILAKSCKERQSYLSILLQQYAAGQGKFARDLQTVETYSLQNGWGINWISNKDTDWVKMMFRCPLGDAFHYSPPPEGQDPKVGDVLAACPNHPGNRLVWDENMAKSLAWRRQAAERRKAPQALRK